MRSLCIALLLSVMGLIAAAQGAAPSADAASAPSKAVPAPAPAPAPAHAASAPKKAQDKAEEKEEDKNKGEGAKQTASNVCTATDVTSFRDAFAKLPVSVPEVKAAYRGYSMPTSRSSDILVFRALAQPAAEGKPEVPRLFYRIVMFRLDGKGTPALFGTDSIGATAATSGDKGTDFRKSESKDPKTLLTFTPEVSDHTYSGPPPWERVRLLIVGCGGTAGTEPAARAELEVRVSNTDWSRFIAIVACLVCYILAALGTHLAHSKERVNKTKAKGGINYASRLQHFNPVILTAGSNGQGSATKLQVFFFSLLVFGVVTYIWLLTGQLTELSQTVLLLMGISGLGATAAAGTELSKNRLDFDNWSWLISREWLPPGGVAEENVATWKDIVTTGGEFDATRFQMVTFSLLVGGALLWAGADLMDLSSFEIPTALLGILGLSQVVYVAGKLTAPPAISELNTQLQKLRKAESEFTDTLSKINVGPLAATTITMADKPDAQAASAAISRYDAEWETAKNMFEATLGRMLDQKTLQPLSVAVLPKATVGMPYDQDLSVSGGTAGYNWVVADNNLGSGLTFGVPANQTTKGKITGTPAAKGNVRFWVIVTDANGLTSTRNFSIGVE